MTSCYCRRLLESHGTRVKMNNFLWEAVPGLKCMHGCLLHLPPASHPPEPSNICKPLCQLLLRRQLPPAQRQACCRVPEAVQLLGLLQAATQQQLLQQLVCHMLRQVLSVVCHSSSSSTAPCVSAWKGARYNYRRATRCMHGDYKL